MIKFIIVVISLCKTDTPVKQTPRVGPCLSFLPLFDSIRRTPRNGPCLSFLPLTLYKTDTYSWSLPFFSPYI